MHLDPDHSKFSASGGLGNLAISQFGNHFPGFSSAPLPAQGLPRFTEPQKAQAKYGTRDSAKAPRQILLNRTARALAVWPGNIRFRGQERCVYIQFGGVKQVRVWRWNQGRRGPLNVAPVTV